MTTAALTAGLERIPDQLGYLVISEDGVLATPRTLALHTGDYLDQVHPGNQKLEHTSSLCLTPDHHLRWYLPASDGLNTPDPGELENDEHTAGVIMQMVRTACRFRLPGSADPCFKRMSVVLEDFVYTVTVSGQKVFVVKRHNNQHEPINV